MEENFQFEIGQRVFIKSVGEVWDANGSEIVELSSHPRYEGVIDERETRPNVNESVYLVMFEDADGRPLTDKWMLEGDLHPVQ